MIWEEKYVGRARSVVPTLQLKSIEQVFNKYICDQRYIYIRLCLYDIYD
jgi:hypothetical protein